MNKLPGRAGPAGHPSVLCVQPVAEQGGSDQALLRLARQLVEAGWQVDIALPRLSPMADSFESAGARLHVVPMRRISTSLGTWGWAAYAIGWAPAVLRLWRLARRCGADIVHSNSLHSWYGWAAARLARRPHIWHAREIVTQSGPALRLEQALCRRYATVVLAASQAIADQLPGAPVRVVYEEADPHEYYPGRAGRARRRLGLADDALLVGYVGRIDTWKGVDVLLDAAPLLAVQRPGTAVVVAGGQVDGKRGYAQELAARAAQLGAHWLGPLAGPDAGDLIADLDVLAYPSTTPEPWGLALVEALACGVPVVSTDAGGPREMLAGMPPQAARLVAPGDPGALADALAGLLPASTSAEARRARSPLRERPPAAYASIFAEVAARAH